MEKPRDEQCLRATRPSEITRPSLSIMWLFRTEHDHGTFPTIVVMLVTWVLSLSVSIYCAILRSDNTTRTPGWDHNYLHPHALTMDGIVASFFWSVSPKGLLLLVPSSILQTCPRYTFASLIAPGSFALPWPLRLSRGHSLPCFGTVLA